MLGRPYWNVLDRTAQRDTLNMMNTENFAKNLMQSITRSKARAPRARKNHACMCLYA